MDGSRLVVARRLGIVAVAVAATAVLLTDFGGGSEGEPAHPPGLVATSAPPRPATTAGSSLTTSVPVSGATLGELVPPLQGRRLVALVGQSAFSLADWSDGDTEPVRQALEGLSVTSVQFDAAGGLMGYLVGASLDNDVLTVGPRGAQFPLAETVTSFAWSRDEAGRIAWIRKGADGLALMVGRPRVSAAMSEVSMVARLDAGSVALRGWSSSGFLIFDPQTSEARWLDTDGEVVGTVGASRVWLDGPAGVLLSVGTPPTAFFHTHPPFTELHPVAGAPPGAGAEYDFASPHPRDPDRYAFLVPGGYLEYRLVISGDTPSAVTVPYRVWDVEWSTRGDLIVMPGTDNEGTHLVVVYEPATDEMHVVAGFGDWVQFAGVP